MPQHEFDKLGHNEVSRVPILPNNFSAPTRMNDNIQSVPRPEITTVSASGTHIDSPSAISEVTDNHAIDISPFDLTGQVNNAAAAAASKMKSLPVEKMKETSLFHQLWSGFLDDLSGAKRPAKA